MQIYDLFSSGNYPVVAALGVLVVVFLSLLAFVVRLISRRFGIKNGS